MAYSTYLIIRQILMGLLLFLGVHMLFVTITEQLHNSFYQRSLKLMGVAFVLVPLSCFIYTQENRLDLQPYISTAINLPVYYATFVLMSISFFILMGKRIGKWLKRVTIVILLLYPLPMWVGILIGGVDRTITIISVSCSYHVIMIILLVSTILYSRSRVLKSIDNDDTPDDVRICLPWVSKSIFPLLGLAVTCIAAPFFAIYPRWIRFLFMLYGVGCYLHIYYGYRRMLINLTEHYIMKKHQELTVESTQQDDSSDNLLSTKVNQNIQSNLEEWISEKRYLKKNFTINDVAKSIYTNRTYLSRYINTRYNKSFKNWVSELRIEEAKKILIEQPELSIQQIVERIGFASLESFTHSFTRKEGMPPSKWREEHRILK